MILGNNDEHTDLIRGYTAGGKHEQEISNDTPSPLSSAGGRPEKQVIRDKREPRRLQNHSAPAGGRQRRWHKEQRIGERSEKTVADNRG